MLEYHFFKLKVFFYNFDNILLHILNAFAAFLILEKILKQKWISFLSAFLFLIHPVHVEAVSNIAGRSIILCAFFVLWGFYFFLRYIEDQNRRLFLVLSVSCYILGLLSKEPAVMLLVLILSYSYIFREERNFSFKKSILSVGIFFLTTILYFALRKVLGITSVFHWNSLDQTFLGILTFLHAVISFIQILVVPIHLYFDRSMVLFRSFTNPVLWIVIIFWSSVLFILIKKSKEISRPVAFFIIWFWVNLLPISQLVPIKVSWDRISTADHFLYLPSIGFIAVIVLCVQRLYQGAKNIDASPKILALCVVGYCLFLALTTLELNFYSRNQMILFERSLKYNPNNTRLRDALAVAYGLIGDFKKSQANFEYVLKEEPWDARAHIGLGKILSDQGKHWEAILQYESITGRGSLEDIRKNNLEYSYQALERDYVNRLKEEPNNALLNYSYGIILSKNRRVEEAIKYYKHAIELDPELKNAYFNLASTYDVLGQTSEAIVYYEKTLNLKPDQTMDSYAFERLAKIYEDKGEHEKSVVFALKAKQVSVGTLTKE
jgi:tetratricopeptide (TPR) repeat protein